MKKIIDALTLRIFQIYERLVAPRPEEQTPAPLLGVVYPPTKDKKTK